MRAHLCMILRFRGTFESFERNSRTVLRLMCPELFGKEELGEAQLGGCASLSFYLLS